MTSSGLISAASHKLAGEEEEFPHQSDFHVIDAIRKYTPEDYHGT